MNKHPVAPLAFAVTANYEGSAAQSRLQPKLTSSAQLISCFAPKAVKHG